MTTHRYCVHPKHDAPCPLPCPACAIECQRYTGEVGCLVGGHEGQYAVISVINIAKDYGMELTTDDEGAVKEYLAGEWEFYDIDDILDVGGLVDRAEEWLNEYVAEDEHSFGWSDGEFFYMEDGWWES